MSTQKMIVPGFGIGASLGPPTTTAVAQTSTVTLAAGVVYMTPLPTGVSLNAISTTGSFTGTTTIHAAGQGGYVFADGGSVAFVNTTTSVNVVLIPLN